MSCSFDFEEIAREGGEGGGWEVAQCGLHLQQARGAAVAEQRGTPNLLPSHPLAISANEENRITSPRDGPPLELDKSLCFCCLNFAPFPWISVTFSYELSPAAFYRRGVLMGQMFPQ